MTALARLSWKKTLKNACSKIQNYPYPKYSPKIDQSVYNLPPLTLNSGTLNIQWANFNINIPSPKINNSKFSEQDGGHLAQKNSNSPSIKKYL
jgi:hypothetical protein